MREREIAEKERNEERVREKWERRERGRKMRARVRVGHVSKFHSLPDLYCLP